MLRSGLEDASRISCALTADRIPSAPTSTSQVALVPSEKVSVIGDDEEEKDEEAFLEQG